MKSRYQCSRACGLHVPVVCCVLVVVLLEEVAHPGHSLAGMSSGAGGRDLVEGCGCGVRWSESDISSV